MTSNDSSTKPRQPAPLARLLAFVLLVFVSYGSTAELAHKHGGLAPERRSETVTSVGSPDDTNPSSGSTRSGGECLICQLHQHLFVSLFSSLPQIAAPMAQPLCTPAITVSYLSRTDTPRRGRAPPTASLL